jgi:hypothetical protein
MLQFERAKLTARWCFNGCVAADLLLLTADGAL